MDVFSKDELLKFNEVLLGRGVPITQDGVGYNKADYGACSTYFNILSDSQWADLAKRLVKYSTTQLEVDKEKMKLTAEHLKELSDGKDRSDGVSISIGEKHTLIGFRYRDSFVRTMNIKNSRRWDAENKAWKVLNKDLLDALRDLEKAGADVKNAMEYAIENIHITEGRKNCLDKLEVLAKKSEDGTYTFLKFDYDEELIKEIKSIPYKDRKWNSNYKFWAVDTSYIHDLSNKLKETAVFKFI